MYIIQLKSQIDTKKNIKGEVKGILTTYGLIFFINFFAELTCKMVTM